MRKLLFILALLATKAAAAQTYEDSIRQWQNHYKQEFVEDKRSPLRAKDTGLIRFFPIDKKWCVDAEVILSPEAEPISMATHSGKTKRFRKWAELRFTLPDSKKTATLSAYMSLSTPSGDSLSGKLLFIPFYDETNGTETYGGGRYMDIPQSAVVDDHLLVDFNKAYNPWCAYSEGYSCPIPPQENNLRLSLRVGELNWIKAEH